MKIFKKLTKKQNEVYDLLMEGMGPKEIARELELSESNVKTHIGNILRKFEEKTTLSLVVNHYKNQLHLAQMKYN